MKPLSLLPLAASLLACSTFAQSAADAATTRTGTRDSPAEVTVIVTDTGFQAPDTLDAGWTTFHLVNQGEQPHMAQIIQLEDGRTAEAYLQAYGEAFRTRGPRPAWAKPYGGPGAAAPGGTANATLYLTPGRYLWGDFVDLIDGTPNALKGLARPFVVRVDGEATDPEAAPEADVTIRMVDYAFRVESPLASGQQLVHVENAGTDVHDFMLWRLAPGKTVDDVRDWVRSPGSPPPLAPPGGGLGALAPGLAAYVELDLAPGDYVLVCLVTAPDRRPHVEHGRIQQLRVE